MNVSAALKRIFALITIKADQNATSRDLRRLMANAAIAARRGDLDAHIEGIATQEQAHREETARRVQPVAIENGLGGVFDACDLRIWLALARRADVEAIPAEEVLRLSEAEADLACGSIAIPATHAISRLIAWAAAILARKNDHSTAREPISRIIPADVLEKLSVAMDKVPDGHMVRHIRSGSSLLKSFAGLGHAGKAAPEARLSSSLEVGPGWVRVGNRRRVDVGDRRTVQAYATGPADMDMIFVARPWVQAARYLECEDPHRRHTPFAGAGAWPAEWRVFIQCGEIVGVSAYYPWAGTTSPRDAQNALEAKRLAQKILDEMKAQNALPRYMDLEFARHAMEARHCEAGMAAAAQFPAESIHCTLDFLEGPQGLLLIEGGPGATPFGGAHFCGFAGAGGPPRHGVDPRIEGIAFCLLDGVNLLDPSTWLPSDPTGRILSFAEAEQLARQSDPV